MTVHINGSKGKELYYNGVKIKEAYYNGNKVYSGIKPLYYCYHENNLGYYYYFQNEMTYVGQRQDCRVKNKNDFSQVSNSSQLTYTTGSFVVTTLTQDGFIYNDGFITFNVSRIKSGDLYT